MTAADARPDIFDRARRARSRDRMMPCFAAHDFLYRAMLEELVDRLGAVQRDLPEALVIGCPDGSARAALEAMGKRVACVDPGFLAARSARGVQADEDVLPFADDSFDLIVACGTLDSVNDLPGALILMRRMLRPDGLMLAAFAGAGSLPRLKAALLAGEGDRPGQHVHPQVDVRSAGDLLSRAGYAMPVADGETLGVRYGEIMRLMHELRGMGAGNVLRAGAPPLTRNVLLRAAAHFADAADPDGRTAEQIAVIYLSGWKPDPSQAKPARRGSATMSLAAALKEADTK
ncbi:SAM-dependent methyltransferase [Sphingobium sp. OAS761]|uniref:class I SAM-dependent methyltransferase n=1 Tax=Sphingobium sp. OAS761 TaxID=2817901 RepID=UPI00209F5E50|nr:class I SAM-dependent methyltransferase [Sphingobium sp. OAS761]MCP1471652.1 SAM-dependent methyltransferase [Sphingobium sp. OAS761]